MDLAIVGTGNVGATLGRRLARCDHQIVFGSRDPGDASVTALVESIGGAARATTQSGAAADGDVVILAVPGDVVASVAGSIAGAVGEKPLIDTTNRIDRGGESLAAAVAERAPDAAVVKAFNTVGFERMADPQFEGGRATMFVASDDPDASAVTAKLARDLGFEVVDAGDLSASIVLEDIARAWIHLSRRLGRDIAFKLLRD